MQERGTKKSHIGLFFVPFYCHIQLPTLQNQKSVWNPGPEFKGAWWIQYIAYMLCVTGVVREKGGDMEHDLPVFVLSVDRSLSSLVVLSVQTTTIPTWLHTCNNIFCNAPSILQRLRICSLAHNGMSAEMNLATCHGLCTQQSWLRTTAMVWRVLSLPLPMGWCHRQEVKLEYDWATHFT